LSSLRQVQTRVEPFPGEIRHLIGDKLGLIRAGFVLLGERSDPEVFNVAWINTDLQRLEGLDEEVNLRAAGAGETLADAAWRAYGELIERYAASTVDPSRFWFGSYRELQAKGEKATDPASWALLHPEQYKVFPGFKPFVADTRIHWIQCHDLSTGAPTWLPAQLVCLTYKRHKEEAFIGYGTSSGCGAGRTVEAALASALREAIERDAFVVTWYSRTSPPHVDVSGTRVQEFHDKRLAKPGLRYHLLDVTQDIGVPVFMAVCENTRGQIATFSVGAACHPDPEEAAYKALLEAAQGHHYVKQLQAKTDIKDIKEPIGNLDDNVCYYGYPESRARISFLIGNPKTVSLRSYPRPKETGSVADVAHMMDRLESVGLDAYAVDLTAPETARAGLHVVRCSIPGAASFGIPSIPYLGSRRIYEVPYKMGHVARPLRWADLNTAPHPFP
jgi:ribosomal protein S12 methylthiotransferase accessory factor